MLEFLDVAIGLIFIFTLLALISSALAEWVSAVFSLRGRLLWQAIGKLVGEELGKQITKHQLVQGLAQGRRPAPSYLEAELFTDALLQEVFNTDKESEVPRDLAKLRNQLRSCIESASGGTRGEGETIAKEKEKLAPVAGALLALAEGTADLGEAKRKISTWYDAAMERLSGVYKRWTQAALFVIGLIMAGGLGVDPLSIASALWENPALRASTVELAEAFVETEAPDSSDSSDDVEQPSKLMEQRMSEARAYAAQLQQSRLPLHPFKDRNNTSDWLRSHWLGFLLSALATAMGAPFWFDLLGRVISLRTSVKSTSTQQRESQVRP